MLGCEPEWRSGGPYYRNANFNKDRILYIKNSRYKPFKNLTGNFNIVNPGIFLQTPYRIGIFLLIGIVWHHIVWKGKSALITILIYFNAIEKYLILQKIEKAKELLVYGELSLKEISYLLGYSSVQHLSNLFKKVTGLSPSHFRNIKDNKRRPLDKIWSAQNSITLFRNCVKQNAL